MKKQGIFFMVMVLLCGVLAACSSGNKASGDKGVDLRIWSFIYRRYGWGFWYFKRLLRSCSN
ncbi:hypothetical protein [Priestia flexa]|uniref:hypothetical protein n=1 Tax=Priestia flexa TaxID=86664 RepID=UPI0014322212|nr:hypothetical protein [Priestia flexa]